MITSLRSSSSESSSLITPHLSGESQPSPKKTKEVGSSHFKSDSPPHTSSLKDRILHVEHVSIFCSLVSTARYIATVVTGLLHAQGYERAIGSLRCSALLSIPVAIYHIGHNIVEGVKGTLNEKIDAALGVTAEIGVVGDATASFATGLQAIGLVAAKALMWTTPLFAVSLALEVAGAALSIKIFAENFFFRRKLSKEASLEKPIEAYSLDDYQKGMDYLLKQRVREKSILDKHIKVHDEKLLNRLLDIELEAKEKIQSASAAVINEGKQLLHNTMAALKGRITTKMISNSLVILSATICIIGGVLLFTPAQPAGYALLALGIVIGFARIAFDYETTRRFENKLELNGKGVYRYSIPTRAFNWIKKRKCIHVIDSPLEFFKRIKSPHKNQTPVPVAA